MRQSHPPTTEVSVVASVMEKIGVEKDPSTECIICVYCSVCIVVTVYTPVSVVTVRIQLLAILIL